MGIPIIAGAGLWKARELVDGRAGGVDLAVLAGRCRRGGHLRLVLAIGLLLRYLRSHSLGIFIAYRLIAAVVFLVLLVVASQG